MAWTQARHLRLRALGAAAAVQGALAAPAAAAGGGILAALAATLEPRQQHAALLPLWVSRSASSYAGEAGAAGLPPIPRRNNGSSGGQPSIKSVQLVRDFIHESLYHPKEGYFSKQVATGAAVVGTLQQPLDFGSLQGQTEYLLAVQALYKELQASWLTPVEIFQPHYGRAVGNAVVQRWNELAADAVAAGHPEPPLRIYEIGGGTGTLARNILDWLRGEHPATYRSCHYACIEISPVLAALQRRKVAQDGGHGGHFSVRQHDATDALAWEAADAAASAAGSASGRSGGSSSSSSGGGSSRGAAGEVAQEAEKEHAFIVMCEVLDNLPHDRVWRDMGSAEWQETLVAEVDRYEDLREWSRHHSRGGEGDYFELTQAVRDPLIARCLQTAEAADSSSTGSSSSGGGKRKSGLALAMARGWRKLLGEAIDEVRWLPTGCLQLLDTLQQARPNHTLIAADFDQLPEVAVPGTNAPLVATTCGGSTFDHGSYLVPRGTADIFFPTDFHLLCQLYREAAARQAQHDHSSNSGSSSIHQTEGTAQQWQAAGARVHAGAQPQVRAEHTSTADFMMTHSPDVAATCTASGYNPLLDDYSNSSFFVGSCLWQRAFFVGSSTCGSSDSTGSSGGGGGGGFPSGSTV